MGYDVSRLEGMAIQGKCDGSRPDVASTASSNPKKKRKICKKIKMPGVPISIFILLHLTPISAFFS